eukprot:COSAG06_NODE_18238_length_897_cov_0.838346_2_plen_204_part_01
MGTLPGSFGLFLVSGPTVAGLAWKMKQPAALSVLERPVAEPPTPSGGQKGAAGSVWCRGRSTLTRLSAGLKKQLRMGVARRLCSGHLPEGSAWLDCYVWDLLTPARGADLPPTAREAGQHWPRRAGDHVGAPLAGSGDAEAHRAASRRCAGFAQTCGRSCPCDTGRSDLCQRHQHTSCGRSARVLSASWKTKKLSLAHQCLFL